MYDLRRIQTKTVQTSTIKTIREDGNEHLAITVNTESEEDIAERHSDPDLNAFEKSLTPSELEERDSQEVQHYLMQAEMDESDNDADEIAENIILKA